MLPLLDVNIQLYGELYSVHVNCGHMFTVFYMYSLRDCQLIKTHVYRETPVLQP